VLITGETGTGKELMANALHRLSGRSGEMVAVNVAGLDDVMLSDTLFGHTRGAFTGADRAREGLLASAANGTIFLDEIGDLALASQVKLLRLLQNGTFYPSAPTGRGRAIRAFWWRQMPTSCRPWARDGSERTSTIRLRTHHVHLPPLRARPDDIPGLVEHLVRKAARQLGRDVPTVPPALHQLLRTHRFPGNVRELEAPRVRRGRPAPGRHALPGELPGRDPGRASVRQGPEESHDAASDPAAGTFPDRLPTLRESEEGLIAEALRRAEGQPGRRRRSSRPGAAGPQQGLSRRRDEMP